MQGVRFIREQVWLDQSCRTSASEASPSPPFPLVFFDHFLLLYMLFIRGVWVDIELVSSLQWARIATKLIMVLFSCRI